MSESLVSVIVVSYNSSQFIIETFESILNQTWQELELIITDDCSGDDTVAICNRWINDNQNRFSRAVIITSSRNTGTSANANRGLYASKGDWVKFIGADDTLKPDCIHNNMSWIAGHPETKVLFSRVEVYDNILSPKTLIQVTEDDSFDPNSIMATGRGADSQYRMLLLSDRIHYTPSAFLHRETLSSVGGYDENFKYLEDYPLWLKLTKNGYKLQFMDCITVNYRRHSNAVNNTGSDYLVNPNYFRSEEFRKVYTYPYLTIDIRLCQRFNYFVLQIFKLDWLNIDRKPARILKTILTLYLNPFKYYISLMTLLNKDLRKKEFYM